MKTKKSETIRKSLLLVAIAVITLPFLLFDLLPVSSQQTTYTRGGVAKIDGVPVRTATIRATNETRGTSFTAETDSRGNFTFSTLTAGFYSFDIIKPNFAHLENKVIPNSGVTIAEANINTGNVGIDTETYFEFDVAKSAVIELRGIIKDSNKNSIADATVKITNNETGVIEEVTLNDDGTYEMAELPSGDYRLEITAPGFKTKSKDLTIENGKTKTKNIELKKDN